MNWLCPSGRGDYNCHHLRSSIWVHTVLEQMVRNYASGWNSKYWQVYRVLSTALCRRCKGGMLIGNLHCEPGHWQLPDRLVSTLLGWTSSTPLLSSLLFTTMTTLTICSLTSSVKNSFLNTFDITCCPELPSERNRLAYLGALGFLKLQQFHSACWWNITRRVQQTANLS